MPTQNTHSTFLPLAIAFLIVAASSQAADPQPLVGTVTNFRGQPFEGARIAVVPDSQSFSASQLTSDSNGEFAFGPVSLPATVVVSAKRLSAQSKRIETVADLDSLDFRMLPGRRARLLIVDQDGKPIDQVSVRWVCWKKNASEVIDRGLNLSTQSDAQGMCLLDSLPAGEVTLEFRYKFFETHRESIQSGTAVQKVVMTKRAVNAILERLDEQATALRHEREWTFTGEEWSESELAIFRRTNSATGVQRENGFEISVPLTEKWHQGRLACRVRLAGDFDVEADCEILDWEESGGLAALRVTFADEDNSRISIERQVNPWNDRLLSDYQWNEDTFVRHSRQPKPAGEQRGTLRLARRGSTVFTLWRAESEDHFDVVDELVINESTSIDGGVNLALEAQAKGQISAIWKRVRIRADLIIDLSKQHGHKSVLSVYNASTNEVRRVCLVTPGMRTVGSPCWSPDEKWIAYDSVKDSPRDSRIMIVPAGGGSPTDIGAGSMPTFSPDGTKIAFSSATEGLGMMDVDGSDRTILDVSGWDLQWSPTGKLSYATDGQFHLIDRDGSSIGPAMEGSSSERYSYLYWNSSWSNDGRRLALKGRRVSDGLEEIAVWNLDDPGKVIVLQEDASQTRAEFSWSDDDQFVFVISKEPLTQQPIAGLAADGSGVVRPAPMGIDLATPTSAVWSPSGQRVAITGTDSVRPPRHIYRMTSEGEKLVRITNRFVGKGEHLSPAISPDGTRLAFELFDSKPQKSRIIYVKIDDSTSTDFGLGCIPSFSSDGMRVLYSSFRGMKSRGLLFDRIETIPVRGSWTLTASTVGATYGSIRNYDAAGANIVIEDGQGKQPRYLLEGEHKNRYEKIPFYFAFSFDGSQVAFIGNRKNPPGRELAVVSTKGSNAGFHAVAEAANLHNDVNWHPDGKRLVVAKNDSNVGYMQLHLMPILDASNAIVIPGQPSHADNCDPAYSPDGKFLYFSSKPIATQ